MLFQLPCVECEIIRGDARDKSPPEIELGQSQNQIRTETSELQPRRHTHRHRRTRPHHPNLGRLERPGDRRPARAGRGRCRLQSRRDACCNVTQSLGRHLRDDVDPGPDRGGLPAAVVVAYHHDSG
jgi:hypothetical protein